MGINANIPLQEAYNDLISPSAKIIGNNLAKICEKTFNIFPTAKIHLCNCSKKVLKQLSNKINNIGKENLQIPDTHLFMKSIEYLQYRDDKDLITQMFINLITNECDKTKAQKVHPALIEILNKMSKEEAMYLYKNKEKLSSGGGKFSYDNARQESKSDGQILLNLLSYGLLAHRTSGIWSRDYNTFLYVNTPLLFLLLENIPNNLELEINEK